MKLSEAVRLLEEAGVPNARHDARELFSYFGAFSKTRLLFDDAECAEPVLAEAIKRRQGREPLQYIIGKAFFYNEEYKVDESCLIPRADTEILVDYACRMLPEGERFLDLCTGSGCVAISTLKNTKNTSAVLVDISEDALKLARENAAVNGVIERAEFQMMDCLCDVATGEYFAVLSNPPYVTEKAYAQLEKEIYFEPKLAFVGGEDGAKFYNCITEQYKDKIKSGGFIAYEIGYDQADILMRIAECNGMSCEIIKDFSGNDRVAVLKNRA